MSYTSPETSAISKNMAKERALSIDKSVGLGEKFTIDRNCLKCGEKFVAEGNQVNYKFVRRCLSCRRLSNIEVSKI